MNLFINKFKQVLENNSVIPGFPGSTRTECLISVIVPTA